MPEISATISLRPVRIGFLVRLTDFTSSEPSCGTALVFGAAATAAEALR